jgi:hypothetical protein
MLTKYYDFLKREMIVYQGAVSVIGSQNMHLLRTYILKGEFTFYEGSKCLFTNDSLEVMVNRDSLDSSISMIDNIHGKNWIHERERYFSRFNEASKLPVIELDSGSYCLINTQWGASNVFHLLFDSIGKLAIMSEYDDCLKYKYLIPSNMSFCRELMDLLGISYFLFDSSRVYKGDIYVPSMPSYCGHVPHSVSKTFRAIGDERLGPPTKNGKGVFIGRKSPSKRLIINQDEVLKLLNQFDDFELIYLEDLSLQDQIEKVRKAKLIVGPHGAGISWSIFSEKPNVFEIHSPIYQNDCFKSLVLNSHGHYSSFTGCYSDLGAENDYVVPVNDFAACFSVFYNSI